jgi:hypothetical protein
MKKGTWPKIEPVEQVKRLVGPLISFIGHPFGPTDLTDDPDYIELRDRVLRNHGVWAPPGSSYRIAWPVAPPGRPPAGL